MRPVFIEPPCLARVTWQVKSLLEKRSLDVPLLQMPRFLSLTLPNEHCDFTGLYVRVFYGGKRVTCVCFSISLYPIYLVGKSEMSASVYFEFFAI